MRVRLTSWLLAATLGATLLGPVTVAMAQPNVRDHRTPPPPPPPPVVHGPTSAPPAVKFEQHEIRRKGFVWQTGRWDWKNNNWAWVPGHWERAKEKSRWREGKWEQRGNEWVFTEGAWEVAAEHPAMAPPALKEEPMAVRGGQVFVRGHWLWEYGEYVWEPGHYEAEKTGRMWREARWEQKGNDWVFTEGGWVDAPKHPTAEPPPPPREDMPGKPGFIFVHGNHEWRNGQYIWAPGHYERERSGEIWVDGRWDHRMDGLEWIPGHWDQTKVPTHPPPAVPDEGPTRGPNRPGMGWMSGRYEWKNGQYVWAPGRWEPGHEHEHTNGGGWVVVGGHYEFREPRWEHEAGGPPPVAYPANYHGPTMAPPPPQNENVTAKAGFVWAKGHHQWANGKFEWVPGHWERERANKHWHDAEWKQEGNQWTYTEGRWE